MQSVSSRLALGLSFGVALTTQAAVTGQWDFTTDLSASIGTALAYRGDTGASTVFSTTTIGGVTANVMQFPATTASQGYILTHGIAANGGGAYVNQYSLIMDLMYPAASTGKWRCLLQTDTANASDGDLFVNTGNGIGISASYQGTIAADTWHRVAVVFDLTSSSLTKYIDGAQVGSQTLSAGTDGRWSLGTTALLFADEDGETAMGYINSLQIHDTALSAADIAGLGGATAAGIPVVPEPASGLLFVAGLALLVVRRNR